MIELNHYSVRMCTDIFFKLKSSLELFHSFWRKIFKKNNSLKSKLK